MKAMNKEQLDMIDTEAENYALQFVPPEEQWSEEHEIKYYQHRSAYIAGRTKSMEEKDKAELDIHRLNHEVKLYEGANDEWRRIVEEKNTRIKELEEGLRLFLKVINRSNTALEYYGDAINNAEQLLNQTP